MVIIFAEQESKSSSKEKEYIIKDDKECKCGLITLNKTKFCGNCECVFIDDIFTHEQHQNCPFNFHQILDVICKFAKMKNIDIIVLQDGSYPLLPRPDLIKQCCNKKIIKDDTNYSHSLMELYLKEKSGKEKRTYSETPSIYDKNFGFKLYISEEDRKRDNCFLEEFFKHAEEICKNFINENKNYDLYEHMKKLKTLCEKISKIENCSYSDFNSFYNYFQLIRHILKISYSIM